MRAIPFKTTLLTFAIAGLLGTAQAQWLAFNDHSPSTTGLTHTNATTRSCAANGSVVLKNITDGELTGCTMTISVSATPGTGDAAGIPDLGTPRPPTLMVTFTSARLPRLPSR